MATVNVLKEILGWSAARPLWQRDALRRLAVQGELQSSDIVELAEICKASHGLSEEAIAEPLDSEHLPDPAATTKPVSLTSLTHNSGVNALASDQTIGFGPSLTIVYGENAAGKSGYTRILKRACRARGAEEILGNVVTGIAPGRPSATIRYSVDDQTIDVDWDDDKPTNPFLSRVSVFDRHCASVYISEQTDVAFRPLGLDLFDKLSGACEAVRRVLEKEQRDLELAALHFPEVASGTAVAELLSRLTSLTNPEKVQNLAALSEEELARIEELRKRLRDLHSEDPQRTARGLELRANRLDILERKLQHTADALSDQAIQKAFQARDQMLEAQRAAEEMRRVAFEQQPLPNTGSDTWRLLWKAAEQFSTVDAYPDDLFPVTETNARCVLCQQQLQDEGVRRMRIFHDFLSSAVQKQREEASALYGRLRAELENLAVTDSAIVEVLEELQIEEGALADSIRSYIDAAQNRRVESLNGLSEDNHGAGDVPAMQTRATNLGEFIAKLRVRVIELSGANRTEVIGNVETELRELESRQVLSRHVKAVLGEIERKKRLAAYQFCMDDTRTNAVTRKSSEVTKLAVTERLTQSFKQELGELGFKHVEVEMVASGGARGSLYHKLQLRRAPGVSVPNVVSEGEARCLSIASFFAELSTAADLSAILFDDPVSSLDNHWRDNVAQRLVKEAAVRQVIVFTHDIVFLMALTGHAEGTQVETSHQQLLRGDTAAGFSLEGLPLAGTKVSTRINSLKNLMQAARKLHRENKPLEYKREGTEIYRLLRQAWERAVEETLLNNTVLRFRNSIESNRAKVLEDITKIDCAELDTGMTKCSKWEGGHDHAAADGSPFPAPDDLEADITALSEWVKRINKRRSKK